MARKQVGALLLLTRSAAAALSKATTGRQPIHWAQQSQLPFLEPSPWLQQVAKSKPVLSLSLSLAILIPLPLLAPSNCKLGAPEASAREAPGWHVWLIGERLGFVIFSVTVLLLHLVVVDQQFREIFRVSSQRRDEPSEALCS